MVELGTIQSQSTTYDYIKSDLADLIVKGRVTFNKDNIITDVNGEVFKFDNTRVAGFNTWGGIDYLRYNLNDVADGMLVEASQAVEAAIEDLKIIVL